MKGFEYYIPPKEITKAENPISFLNQAKEPEMAHPNGITLSNTWEVMVDGEIIPVMATPVTFRGPHHFCQLRYTSEPRPLSFFVRNFCNDKITVRGLEGNISIVRENGGIEFQLSTACHVTLESNGKPDEPLSIFLAQEETDRPDRSDPNVIWFEPGLHMVDRLILQDNQTIYLENGALLQAIPPKAEEVPLIEDDWAHVPEYEDFITAPGRKHITIRGMGIIETTQLPWHARRTIYLEDCVDVRIEDIITIGSAHWTIVPYHCRNVRVYDVKVFGYRTNSDAIDLVNCKDVEVSNCYLRTGDDAVCLKGMLPPEVMGGENVSVKKCTIWTEKARSLGVIGETRGDFRNILFEDCLILHGYANWTKELGALCIVLSDGGTVEDVLFRNIEIIQEDSWVIDCMIRPDFWSTDQKPGHIRNICFENIVVPNNAEINMEGFDRTHIVENVLLKNVHSCENEVILQFHRNDFVGKVVIV